MEIQFYKSIGKAALFCFSLFCYLYMPQAKAQVLEKPNQSNESSEARLTNEVNGLEVIWGLASSDENEHGPDNIFSVNSDGTGYAVHHTYMTETQQMGKLVQANDNYFYGVTLGGGDFGGGTVYRIGTDGSNYSILHHFNSSEGSWPSNLLYGGDGFLYGTTSGRGEFDRGTVFRIQTNGENFQVIRHNERDFSFGVNIVARDGYLYGFSMEHLFRLSTDGNYFEVIASLPLPDPINQWPSGRIFTQGSDGYLYGSYGGQTSVLFKINTTGESFEVLKEDIFINDFLEYSDGVFFGIQNRLDPEVIHYSVGAVFTINADGSGFTLLQRLEPWTALSLLKGNDGFLYGSTLQSIYRIRPDGTGFTTIRDFTPEEGFITRITLLREVCPSPLLNPIEISPDVAFETGNEIIANAAISGNVLTAYWNWGDGNVSSGEIIDSSITGSHIYDSPGNYSITLTVTDACGLHKFFKEITIDGTISNGSLKGTGLFSSPRGAYKDKPQMKGMAHYSIHARPTQDGISGTFQFKIADLHFRSTKLERLIVEDNAAWLYGEGKIKGKGRFGFLVAAVDEDEREDKGKGKFRHPRFRGKDKIRVKIWDLRKGNRIVYDNQLGSPDQALATQEIDRGTIIILEEETVPIDQKEIILEQLRKLRAFPNPVQDRVTVDLGDLSPDIIQTVVTDAFGRMELHDIHRVHGGNQLEFDLSSLKFGFYYIQIRTEHGYRSIKLLKR